jgi:steroid delta-isomerase-like uncharacterized protein
MQTMLLRAGRTVALAAAVAISAPAAWAQDALGVVTAYLAAWNAHDSAAAAGHLAENATYYDASVGTPVEGRDAAKTQVIDAFLTAAPDAAWKMRGDPVVSGNTVAFEWTFSGTNTGPWADGTAATGKPFSFEGASVIRVDGGAIVYQADYYDALGFYKQLGLM